MGRPTMRFVPVDSVHMRAHLQAEHMDARDLIVTNLQKDLASRGPSKYGRGYCRAAAEITVHIRATATCFARRHDQCFL
jgi:uncharacterized protein involved in propanediol utilization